ncbi:peptide ABC transporter substrate-binding protein [Pseudohaliea rubra]|uniref:Oligopeptide ABC transporter, periplasmic oligopeptide-binding protein OppA n=1 Tax=Pseudohaliea rubra DSM 19751 TaxID=1265313 RepID=A0A095XTZ9_9GAMM|nr:peptide ABC transporter substrate-binding protein [Pseudohaliea rubra]KGE03116.1 Oligopeptide ABC transporter, periplasmic oligopeptide-binding protein OppA [Pseudohaliea rubra DSM 19751]
MPKPSLIAFALSFLLALTACGGGGETNVERGNREGILHYGNGSEPQGLDPHVVTGVPENHLIRALFEGLAVKNPHTLEPEPGVAESWNVSEDGRVVTFHLRADARWSNGDPVTAEQYVWSWRRALHPEMGNLYAYMLYPVKNAEAFATGKLADFGEVGVKALDPRTLEVTLTEPTPYFIQLMDHYSTFAVHPETILAHGEMTDRFTRWTRVDNIVSNGPFELAEWKLNRRIRMTKSETYWDKGRVRLNGVVFYPTENEVSEERMFRAGALHYTQSLPLNKIPIYQAREDSPYVQAAYLGTYFYLVNTERPPLDDVRVRKALSMAVDRETLSQTVMQGSVVPAYSITPPGTLGYEPPRVFDHDPEAARRLLAEAGYPNGEGWPAVELIYNTQEAHRKIAVAVQQMWKDVLNIEITIANQEWKVYLDSVSTMNFDIARRGWIGDYVDPNNFLDLYLSGGGNNNTGFANPVYDDLIQNRAPRAKSREERYRLFREAEAMLMEQMPIIPIYTYTSRHLIHLSVRGMPANLMDSLNLRYVWLDPHQGRTNEETK